MAIQRLKHEQPAWPPLWKDRCGLLTQYDNVHTSVAGLNLRRILSAKAGCPVPLLMCRILQNIVSTIKRQIRGPRVGCRLGVEGEERITEPSMEGGAQIFVTCHIQGYVRGQDFSKHAF